MARVKLLRQSLEDYNKKLGVTNTQTEAANAAYQQAYDTYSGQTDAYNTQIEAFNAEMAGLDPGDVFQDETGQLKTLTTKGQIVAYQPFQMGQVLSAPYQGKDGGWYYDNTTVTSPAEYDSEGRLLSPEVTAKTPIKINLEGVHPGAGPTAPAEPTAPEAPRAPNLTQSDLRELRSPSLDQAGMQMTANKGIIGKSELTGMEQSKISAFSDPEDPNNLKEAGILARTLGGQL